MDSSLVRLSLGYSVRLLRTDLEFDSHRVRSPRELGGTFDCLRVLDRVERLRFHPTHPPDRGIYDWGIVARVVLNASVGAVVPYVRGSPLSSLRKMLGQR